MKHGACVYILTNQNNKVLYTGVTSILRARIWEHRTKFYLKSLQQNIIATKLFGIKLTHELRKQFKREKQIKGDSRKDKEELIKNINPTSEDLCEDIQNL